MREGTKKSRSLERIFQVCLTHTRSGERREEKRKEFPGIKKTVPPQRREPSRVPFSLVSSSSAAMTPKSWQQLLHCIMHLCRTVQSEASQEHHVIGLSSTRPMGEGRVLYGTTMGESGRVSLGQGKRTM